MLAVVGLVAQLVDGSLGMAYGVTSTTLLLSVGITPAVASAADSTASTSVWQAVVSCSFAGGGRQSWARCAWT